MLVPEARRGGSATYTYNNAIPLLMNEYLPNGVLGIAVTGLLAAFMAGMAANVSSFNTVFTYDIWQDYISKDRPDALLPADRPADHGRSASASASAPRSSPRATATS